jgi:protein gp37
VTAIEWTDETWNPTVGCSRVSPGCDNCYAIGVAHRAMQPAHEGLTIRTEHGTDWTGEVRCLPERLGTPLHWRKPRRVFVDSMSDLFHPEVPDDFVLDVFTTMARTPQHTYQVLTKRPQRMAAIVDRICWHDVAYPDGIFAADGSWNTPDMSGAVAYLSDGEGELPLENVWLGTSIESDRYAWRADHLREAPAAVRFLSLEPLLGPLPSLNLTGIDWVIVGGESGPGARPMHPAWVRDIRDRCADAGVAFFFKQWGDWEQADRGQATHLLAEHGVPKAGGGHHEPSLIPIEDGTMKDPYGPGSGVQDLVDRGHPGWVRVRRVGKKRAGRDLDGRTWDEMPAVTR